MATGEHSYHRRSHSHDYHSPFIYHIVLKKAAGCDCFGSVGGNPCIRPGNPGAAIIKETELGQTIAKSLIHLPFEFPELKLLQFCVMPDHIHILLQVLVRTKNHLDFYVDSLVRRITESYSKRKGTSISPLDIFEPGYCDKLLYDDRCLNALFRYIRENPHRLAMRQQYPQFFQRVSRLKIGDREYEAYGNLFLFRNPDKEAVKISRKYTIEETERLKARWLEAAAKGSVIVSPFISQSEKSIRDEAELLGARIILITHEAFPERYKPSHHDFELCSQGRLLILSLGATPKTKLTRELCLQMNSLAAAIACNS